MRKAHIHSSIDIEIYDKFINQVGHGNVSREIEGFMANAVAVFDKDVEGLNIKMLETDTNKLKNKISKFSAELKAKEELIEKYRESRENKIKKKLEEEKKAIEDSMKCDNCGGLIPEDAKRWEFPKGTICKSCFMSGIDISKFRK